jgi:hypothetical protein
MTDHKLPEGVMEGGRKKCCEAHLTTVGVSSPTTCKCGEQWRVFNSKWVKRQMVPESMDEAVEVATRDVLTKAFGRKIDEAGMPHTIYGNPMPAERSHAEKAARVAIAAAAPAIEAAAVRRERERLRDVIEDARDLHHEGTLAFVRAALDQEIERLNSENDAIGMMHRAALDPEASDG